jgi:hypothetical protein
MAEIYFSPMYRLMVLILSRVFVVINTPSSSSSKPLATFLYSLTPQPLGELSQSSHRTKSMIVDSSGTSSPLDPLFSLVLNSKLLKNSPFDVWLRFIHHVESISLKFCISCNLSIQEGGRFKGLSLSKLHRDLPHTLEHFLCQYCINILSISCKISSQRLQDSSNHMLSIQWRYFHELQVN